MFYLIPLLLIGLWLIVPAALAALLPPTPLSRTGAASALGIVAWLMLSALWQPISFAFSLRLAPQFAPWLIVSAIAYAALFARGLGRRPEGVGAAGFGPHLIESGLLAPLDEELLFRGIVLGWLVRQMPFATAIAVSAVLFVAVHELARIGGVRRTLRESLADLAFGLLAGLLYASSGSILLPIALHMAVNVAAAWTAPAGTE